MSDVITVVAPQWTRETIYKPEALSKAAPDNAPECSVPPRFTWDDLQSLRQWKMLAGIYPNPFTAAYTAELLREDDWRICSPVVFPPLDPEVRERVGRRQMECPMCQGKQVLYGLQHGLKTGLEVEVPSAVCYCRQLHSFWADWANKEIVSLRFSKANLATLEPYEHSQLPAQRQQEIIDLLKAHPGDSHYLLGGPGTGKTHMITALYRKTLHNWSVQEWKQRDDVKAVWRVSTSRLLQEYLAWENRHRDEYAQPTKLPTVTVDGIVKAAKAGYRPALFLDEVDKCNPTPFQIGKLIEVVDAVYAEVGQVVATANKSVDDLIARWGSDEAGTVLRRIGAGPGAHSVRFAG